MNNLTEYTQCYEYKIPCGLVWDQAVRAMDEIIARKPQLIISIGALCSQAARHSLNRFGVDIPHIFSEVTSPYHLGLVPNEANKFASTGISLGPVSYTLFHALKPDMKKALIPYSHNIGEGNSLNGTTLAQELLHKKGIPCDTIDVTNLATKDIKKYDTLILLEGCITESLELELVERYKNLVATIFSFSRLSLKKGSAAEMVAYPSHVGEKIYHYIECIMFRKKRANELPLLWLRTHARKILINYKEAKKQNIFLPPETLYFLNHGVVIGDYQIEGESSFIYKHNYMSSQW